MLLQPDRFRHTPTAAPERASSPRKRDAADAPTSSELDDRKRPPEQAPKSEG